MNSPPSRLTSTLSIFSLETQVPTILRIHVDVHRSGARHVAGLVLAFDDEIVFPRSVGAEVEVVLPVLQAVDRSEGALILSG
jgi:hypothetical protein